jgi:hypothetical protein
MCSYPGFLYIFRDETYSILLILFEISTKTTIVIIKMYLLIL